MLTRVVVTFALAAALAAAASGVSLQELNVARDPATLGAETPASAAADAVTAGYNWEVEAVSEVWPLADLDGVGFALDGGGKPHFVYVSAVYDQVPGDTDYVLKYGRLEKEKWLTETIPVTTPAFYDSEPTVKLNARGTPVVAFIADCSLSDYVRDRRRTLTVAWRTANGWVLTDVESAVYDVGRPALALDARGNPHVAYARQITLGDACSVCYASWEGDRWRAETVDEGVNGYAPSLALDGQGRPHISFCKGGAIGYAYRGGATWELYTSEEPDPRERVAETAIAVDAAARPYIAYYGGENDLAVRFQTDNGWETRTVDEAGDVGFGLSLALDDRGYPYISYRSRYHVKFAHWTGDGWFVQTVAYGAVSPDRLDSSIAYKTTIAVDAGGVPHICFYRDEYAVSRVYLASWRGGAWRLPPGGDVEVITDLSDEVELTPWGAEVRALSAGGSWPTTTSTLYESPWSLYAAPTDNVRKPARKVGEIPPATSVDVIDARSVWTTFIPGLSEEGEESSYLLWLRVRAAGLEGWLEGEAVATPDALVRFAAPYGSLRERPSPRAPAIRSEYNPEFAGWLLTKPAVVAGDFYRLEGRCGSWLMVNKGWLPATAPGLEFYVRTFEYRPAADVYYVFYFPIGDDVARVLYEMSGYAMDAGDIDRYPVVTVTTRDGRSYDVIPYTRYDFGWYETADSYFEAVLPEPVKRADIVAITFTLGERGERIRAAVDPRPAWAGP